LDNRAHGAETVERRSPATIAAVSDSSLDEPAERVGVFVVRAWMEPAQPASLRMRVTRSLDVRSPLTEVSATADVDEVCDALRRWLQDFRGRSGSDPPGGEDERSPPATSA
jgi:hypothetical protein